MRAKKVLVAVCMVTLNFTILVGCGRRTQSFNDSLTPQLAQWGRTKLC